MAPPTPLARARLFNQQLLAPRVGDAAGVVRWFGAVQAQDYPGALWAVGQRVPQATEADVEAAIAARAIVRTWPMRGTLHFVPGEDARWMLRLLSPRVVARSSGRHRQLGLAEADFTRARKVLERALRDGGRLSRPETYAALQRGGVSPEGQRGIHIIGHLAQQQLICHGPRQGRQPTFVLLEDWVPRPRDLPREEALATLASRYFASHGPATPHDFAWWSGLPIGEARRAMDAAGSKPGKVPRAAARGPVAALLPPWDEYVVAYKDRTHALGGLDAAVAGPGMAIGRPLIVIDGRVRGSWGREVTTSTVRVRLDWWGKASEAERRAVDRAARRYAAFLGKTPR